MSGFRATAAPFSRNRKVCPLDEPGGMRSMARPSIVGTSIFAPSAASLTVIGTRV